MYGVSSELEGRIKEETAEIRTAILSAKYQCKSLHIPIIFITFVPVRGISSFIPTLTPLTRLADKTNNEFKSYEERVHNHAISLYANAFGFVGKC